MGKESDFAAEAVEQSAEELPLIETIEGFVQGGCGGVEVDGGRDADDGVKLGRCGGAEVASEFEDEVAAHGVADE